VLACVRNSLARAGVAPAVHLLLNEFGVKKRKHADFDPDEADSIYQRRIVPAARALELAESDIA
jgi:uncharacterized metal-binding protein